MADRVMDGLAILSVFFLTSFPFFTAVPNLMYLSEKNKAEPNEMPPASIGIYIHVVFLFICGICLKLRAKTALLSFLIAVENVIFGAYFISLFSTLKYHKWAKLRFLSHMIGVVASYMTLLAAARQSSRWQRFSCLLFSIYTVACAYVVLKSQTYPVIAKYLIKKAAEYLPLRTRPDWSYQALMWAAGFFVAPGLLMPFGWSCRLGSISLVLTVSIFNGVYDCLFGAWMKKEKLDYWVAVRVAVDNLAVVFALCLIYTKTHTLLRYSQEELQMMMAMAEEEEREQKALGEIEEKKEIVEKEEVQENENEFSQILGNANLKKRNHVLFLESNDIKNKEYEEEQQEMEFEEKEQQEKQEEEDTEQEEMEEDDSEDHDEY